MLTARMLVPVLLLAQCAAGQDDPAAADLKALQGVWMVTRRVADGVEKKQDGAFLIFVDNQMALPGERSALRFYVNLVPGATPKAIDFSAPEPGKDKPPLPGIYDLKGEAVWLCVAQGEPGKLRRPTAFESKPGSKDLLLILERPKR